MELALYVAVTYLIMGFSFLVRMGRKPPSERPSLWRKASPISVTMGFTLWPWLEIRGRGPWSVASGAVAIARVLVTKICGPVLVLWLFRFAMVRLGTEPAWRGAWTAIGFPFLFVLGMMVSVPLGILVALVTEPLAVLFPKPKGRA